jgi:hypothetical protein
MKKKMTIVVQAKGIPARFAQMTNQSVVFLGN